MVLQVAVKNFRLDSFTGQFLILFLIQSQLIKVFRKILQSQYQPNFFLMRICETHHA